MAVRGPCKEERREQVEWILKGSGSEFLGWHRFKGAHSICECRCGRCGEVYYINLQVMAKGHLKTCFKCRKAIDRRDDR